MAIGQTRIPRGMITLRYVKIVPLNWHHLYIIIIWHSIKWEYWARFLCDDPERLWRGLSENLNQKLPVADGPNLHLLKLDFSQLYFSKLYFPNCIFPNCIFLNCNLRVNFLQISEVQTRTSWKGLATSQRKVNIQVEGKWCETQWRTNCRRRRAYQTCWSRIPGAIFLPLYTSVQHKIGKLNQESFHNNPNL